jgi:hypothetical protein
MLRRARGRRRASLANINYVFQSKTILEVPLIYLYRDGRDVAVSFHKAVVGEKHFYHIAREWAATQELALRIQREIEPGRFFTVSYEELIGDPLRTARDICDFLGVPYHAAMLEFHRTDEAKRAATSSELWVNVTKPVMKTTAVNFARGLSAGYRDLRSLWPAMCLMRLDMPGAVRKELRRFSRG